MTGTVDPTAPPRVHERLLAAADGTVADTEAALAGWSADEVGELVMAEVAGRVAPAEGSAPPMTIQFDLGFGERRLGYGLALEAGSATVRPGWPPRPAAVVRQDLTELLRAVYGAPGPVGAPTPSREVRTDIEAPTAGPTDGLSWTERRNATARALRRALAACGTCAPDLTDLAVRFGTDKWGGHWYTPHYERHFAPLRHRRIRILEIGIGGYRDPRAGGASLRMWKHYFPRGLVHGLDLFDKAGVDEPRVTTAVGDQSDRDFLRALYRRIGPLDVVVDDGSHINEHVITSFTTLFPLLPAGGLYVIEDLLTSYWPAFGGSAGERVDPATSVGFLKTLIDGLHHQDRIRTAPGDPDEELALGVVAIHLYHNIVFIEKGVNSEQTAPAAVPREGELPF